MAGQLQGHAFLLGNREVQRLMRQQNAGPISIQSGTLQQCAEERRSVQFRVMHADDLQSIDFHFFVVQNPDPGALHGIEILGAVGEFLMIAGDKIDSRRGGKGLLRLDERIQIRLGPVKQIAADEHGISLQLLKFGDNAAGEPGAPGIAQMQIGHQRQGATAPVCGQVGQLDRDARRAQPAGVYKAVNAREHGSSKECGGDDLRLDMERDQRCRYGEDPGRACCEKSVVQDTEPDCGNSIAQPQPEV